VVRCAIMCTVVVATALPARAQTALIELSGGYNFLRLPGAALPDENLPAGWYADVAANVTDMFAAVGQVDGNYQSREFTGDFAGSMNTSVHRFMGGVRVHVRTNPRVVPFGQVLVGAMHVRRAFAPYALDTETDAALQAGGGVNLMSRNIGVRVGLDYMRVFGGYDLIPGVNGFRFAAGVVYGFGRR